VDPQMWKDLAEYNKNSQSAASNPGLLRVNYLKFALCFPKWPLIWTSLLLVSVLLTVLLTWFGLILVLLLGAINLFYWYIVRMKFVAGCVNPGVVVSLDPPLVAVLTNLTKGGDDVEWNYIRVLPQPLSKMTGGPPQVGQRVASVALYQNADDNSPHWESFAPTLVGCVTWNEREIARVLQSISPGDWKELQIGMTQLTQPPAEGLYKVEMQPPRERALDPAFIGGAVEEVLPHRPDKHCYLASRGIPPQLLQTALAAIAPRLSPQGVLALVLANRDASGQQGLILASEGVAFRISDTLRGTFRWSDVWGAGTSRRQFEILLAKGQRFRFDQAFADHGLQLEALFDGIAKFG